MRYCSGAIITFSSEEKLYAQQLLEMIYSVKTEGMQTRREVENELGKRLLKKAKLNAHNCL